MSDAGSELGPAQRTALGALGLGLLALGTRSAPLWSRLTLGAVGAGLAYLSLKGEAPVATALKVEGEPSGEVLVRDAVTIQKSPAELYGRWRDLARLPDLMSHLERVEVLDEQRSRWTVKAPLGQEVSWVARLTADEPGHRIAWESEADAEGGTQIENSGEVLFREAPGGRGSEVVVRLRYRPPLGTLGAVLARALGEEPAQQLRDDLMRFKREQELGFAPTTQGQTSARPADQARADGTSIQGEQA